MYKELNVLVGSNGSLCVGVHSVCAPLIDLTLAHLRPVFDIDDDIIISGLDHPLTS